VFGSAGFLNDNFKEEYPATLNEIPVYPKEI